MQTEVNSWYCKADDEKGVRGSQIDMLIIRKDQVINLCEMKFSASQYTLKKELESAGDAQDRRVTVSASDTRNEYSFCILSEQMDQA